MTPATSILRSLYRKVRPRPARPAIDLERLFFLHVPKCGGTSINTALERAYRAAGAGAVHLDPHAAARAADLSGDGLRRHKEQVLLYFMAGHHRYISGHFNYSAAAWDTFGDAWRYVTVLREPVARWLSNYFYNRYKTNTDHYRIDEPLEAFVETDRARFYGGNYVTSLSTTRLISEASSDEAIGQAVANLERFAVAGVLEHLGTFASDCERYFGVSLDIGHRNANPRTAGQQQEEISPELMERIRALCAPNLQVYEAALNRIDTHGSWLPR
ncbi:MAG: hypothetical protein AAGF99_00100 [Bacteroidota bacterium]